MLNLYTIDMKYIRDLHKVDDKVPSVSPQVGKAHRLFIGTVIVVNERSYCIPLSSAKPKHCDMGKRIDISKIYDSHHNLIAVLNYNQMIPVTDSQIVKYNIKVLKTDNEYWRKYKKLCEQELRWCRKHEEEIKGKAKLLYQMYISGQEFKAKKRCLDFLKLEEACDKYNTKLT